MTPSRDTEWETLNETSQNTGAKWKGMDTSNAGASPG